MISGELKVSSYISNNDISSKVEYKNDDLTNFNNWDSTLQNITAWCHQLSGTWEK
jgi:hypothetical protein